MQQFTVNPIGSIEMNEEGMFVRLDSEYIPALRGLDGFSHINILCWFHGCDNAAARSFLEMKKPYRSAPPVLGTFATRAPARPNPVALSAAQVLHIDHEAGVIWIDYTDANPGTPVIDLKPYTPSIDRVEHPQVPDWCAHWPANREASGEFDWENEFLWATEH